MSCLRYLRRVRASDWVAWSAAILAGCMGFDPGLNSGTSFHQVNLITDTTAYAAKVIDTNLANPWGIAPVPGGSIWVADNHSGLASLYDGEGNAQGDPVPIPGPADSLGSASPGSPTGLVYNPTVDFQIPGAGKAKIITAGEDGIISAWNNGEGAHIVVDRSASGAVYKGLALAADGGRNFLYVANFRGHRIEVFDATFQQDSTRRFVESGNPAIPADFAPFNIVLVDKELFVTYARLKSPESEDDSAGVGSGYVSVFGTDGSFKRRFASNGNLNSPWAIVSTSGFFGPFEDGIFIGNFGDGLINVFDDEGQFLGQVQDSSNHPILIEGLWGLYLSGSLYGEATRLFFAAGPGDEKHGLFGYLAPE